MQGDREAIEAPTRTVGRTDGWMDGTHHIELDCAYVYDGFVSLCVLCILPRAMYGTVLYIIPIDLVLNPLSLRWWPKGLRVRLRLWTRDILKLRLGNLSSMKVQSKLPRQERCGSDVLALLRGIVRRPIYDRDTRKRVRGMRTTVEPLDQAPAVPSALDNERCPTSGDHI